jgi:bifunctional non-homologous end joining protein LigD
MPPMPRTEPALAISDDPLEWRPQFARQTQRPAQVPDPILEPDWDGVHVLVHFELRGRDRSDPSVRLVDAVGDDATDLEPDITRALEHSVMAVDAVIDGLITEQATRSGIGASIITQPKVPRSALLMRGDVGLEIDSSPVERSDHAAFVAIDLLRLDGQVLLDLPLLERKRLLDGLIQQSDLVRVTPFTRPPIGPWLNSWKSAGFKGLIMKASNSRYRPSSLTDDWTLVSKIHGR